MEIEGVGLRRLGERGHARAGGQADGAGGLAQARGRAPVADDPLGDRRKALEHADPPRRDGLEGRGAQADLAVQFLDGEVVGLVAMVVLEYDRHVLERAAVAFELAAEFVERGEVVRDPLPPRVEHEHDAVDLVDQLLASRHLIRCARWRHDLEPCPDV